MAIDPHVHLRDWNQLCKETIRKGLYVAFLAGLDGVFEMPNTDPAIVSYDLIQKRLEQAEKEIEELGFKMFHGLYAGVTDNEQQIEEVLKGYYDFQRVVGLKMFAGQSTGNMGLVNLKQQSKVYETLVENDYKGVLAVHCEKESLFGEGKFDLNNPITHAQIRNPQSEIESIRDQLMLAEKNQFQGTLYIVHASIPESISLINSYKQKRNSFDVVVGVTPHHTVLNQDYMDGKDGVLRKMNPPLRTKESADRMLELLLEGEIDFIETDHAPHTLKDKYEGYASGIPGLPFYPEFIKIVKEKGMSYKMIQDLTHNNIERTFGLKIPDTNRIPNDNYQGLQRLYRFDAFEVLNR
jgi:dihydroorotase